MSLLSRCCLTRNCLPQVFKQLGSAGKRVSAYVSHTAIRSICGDICLLWCNVTHFDTMQAFFDSTTKGELLTRLTVDVQRLSAAVADNLGQRGVRSLFEVRGL